MASERSDREDAEFWRAQFAQTEESDRNARGTTLCPNCQGASLPLELLDRQVAMTGDLSGACGTCGNTHEVPLASVSKGGC